MCNKFWAFYYLNISMWYIADGRLRRVGIQYRNVFLNHDKIEGNIGMFSERQYQPPVV